MKKQILAVMALAIIFASCQKNEETEKTASKYISVNAGIGSLTRATSTTFEEGDQISIYAWAGLDIDAAVASPLIVDNSINTLNGITWSAEPLMLWKDMVTPHYFVATYPTQTVADFDAYEFTLTGVEADDDLLFATNTTGLMGNDKTAVPLIFSHSQSKIIVNLTFRDQFDGIPTVEGVTVLAKNIAIIDFLTMRATAKLDATPLEFIIPEITANTKYESVVVPQTINKITVTIDGNNFAYNNTSGILLVQGKTQTINLIVGRNTVELGDIIINDWTDGEIINGGDAEQE